MLRADGGDVADAEVSDDFVENLASVLTCGPFFIGAEEIPFGDHLENGADVLRHAAMDEDEAVLEALAGFGSDFVGGENAVIGEQAAAADAEFDVAFGGGNAFDELDAGPNATGVLPATAGATEPLAEDRAGCDEAAFWFRERAGERCGLTGGAHADGDERCEQIGGDSEARALGNVVDVADDFEAEAVALCELAEEIGERLIGAFQTGGDDAGGDDGRFEEAEIVAAEVEHLLEFVDFDAGVEVDTDEPDDRPIDDAEVGFDGRLGALGSVKGEVDGDIEDAGPLGQVHAEEENVAPAAVAEVHADRGGFMQDGSGRAGRCGQEFAAETQRVVGWMAGAEHPLIAADGADAATDLVGERLEREAAIRGGESAGEAVADAVRGLSGKEDADGFFIAAVEEPFDSGIRDHATGRLRFQNAAEGESDGWRRGRRGRERDRRDCRLCGGVARGQRLRRSGLESAHLSSSCRGSDCELLGWLR